MKRKTLPLFLVILILIIVSACVSSTPTANPQVENSTGEVNTQPTDEQIQTEKPVATDTSVATYTPVPTKTPVPTRPPTETPDPNMIEPGTHLVGSDIQPGLFKGQESGCYWERLKGLSGEFDDIIANGNSNGQFYVQIVQSDFAFSTDCSMVRLDKIPENDGDYPQSLAPGVYLVGSDIQPGLYKGQENGCYWERLKDLSGGFDGIEANGNSNGQFYVQVDDDDLALSTDCEVTFLNQIPEHSGDYPQTIVPGTYLIGSEIKPGLYQGQEEGCYWERLRDLSGSFNALIANGNSDGQFYVQVNEGDFALSTDCELTFVNQ
jgi:hypothetical protein